MIIFLCVKLLVPILTNNSFISGSKPGVEAMMFMSSLN